MDYNGRIKNVKARRTELKIGTLHYENEYAPIFDLQHMKSARDFPILGLAGAQLFAQYELVFDFQRSEILLFDLDKSGKIHDPTYSGYEPDIVLPLGLKGHMPYIEIEVGTTTLKMGLDTGAEIALIHPKYKEDLKNHLVPYGNIDIFGVGKKKVQSSLWRLYNLKCSFLLFKAMSVTFSDFGDFNSYIPGVDLDGILGTEFLCQFMIAMNTKKKELHIWLSKKQEALVAAELKTDTKDN